MITIELCPGWEQITGIPQLTYKLAALSTCHWKHLHLISFLYISIIVTPILWGGAVGGLEKQLVCGGGYATIIERKEKSVNMMVLWGRTGLF